jgi:poly(A) polymerase
MPHWNGPKIWFRPVIDGPQTVTRDNRRLNDEPDESEGHTPSHRLSLRDVDADALKVVRKLHAAGHEAYLVGGCVRDLYLNRKPKDFDVATSARPEQIRRVFRNSRIIGRRFKLAHVFFGTKVIETSTFRAPIDAAVADDEGNGEDEDLLITHDNEWGDVEQDARRRDFTIGDPLVRFREDPVRMIRAIKFAARLDFTIDAASWSALLECAPDIARCSRARLVEELYKLLRGGACKRAFELMLEADLFQYIWPAYMDLYDEVGGLHRPVRGEPQDLASTLFWRYLGALDDYVLETGQTPSNGVIQAILFAPLLDKQLLDVSRAELDVYIDDLMTPPCAALGVARRDRELARQIFMAHRRMMQPSPKRGGKSSLVQRQYFHDALLFLGFTVEARDKDGAVLEHWQQLASGELVTGVRVAGSDGERSGSGGQAKRRRSRGRRGRRKPRREGDGPAGARASES